MLVVIGAMSDGRKQVLAIRSGHRESTESWLKVLRDLRDRGLCAPVLLMADGGLPIWSAAEQVWPEAAQQRCWNHKIINVLDDLPKRVQGKARALRRFPWPRRERRPKPDATRSRPVTESVILRPWPPSARLARWSRSTIFPSNTHLRTPVEAPSLLYACAPTLARRCAGATALIWRVLMVAEKRETQCAGASPTSLPNATNSKRGRLAPRKGSTA